MQLGQAIMSCRDSNQLRQNELIASSENIEESLAQILSDWSPCRTELAEGQSESFNFFQPNDHTLALSRSFIGGREYSRSENQHLITHFIVLERSQLSGYENNIVLLARILRSMGMLMLQTSWPRKLELVNVPETCFQKPNKFRSQELISVAETVSRAIAIHQQVILIGHPDPLTFLNGFLAELSPSKRLDLSFSTGLKVTDSRPFNLQFFPRTNPSLELELASRQLRTISLEPKPVAIH